MRGRPSALILAIAVVVGTTRARAEDPPREPGEPSAVGAFAVGALAAMLPLAIGGMHAATGSSSAAQDQGLVVAATGLALAPILSHVAVGETERGFAFGAIPLASAIGIGVLVEANPGAVYHGTVGSRTAFAILFNVSIFGAALGIVDATLAPARYRVKSPPRGIHFAPSMGLDHFLLGIESSL